jgi:beta-glucosidase
MGEAMTHVLHSGHPIGGVGAASKLRAAMMRFLARLAGGRSTSLALVAAAAIQSAAASQALPWMNTALTPEERAALLVGAMTRAQKEQQLVGTVPGILPELPQCKGGRHVSGIPSLGIPTLRITNGPVGIGQNDCVSASVPPIPVSIGGELVDVSVYSDPSSAKATALPSAIALASSFDPAVATEFGNVIGTEANNLALHVFEAPGANMARNPVLGRNFEYFGEDPFLTGTMAVAEIKAVQSNGLIAMAKHFAANEQETNRMTIQEIIDDRVLHEIYLLPFEMAVKDGGTAAVMCSYNSVNGLQACEQRHLLTDVLRNQWGYKGYVQSDFFAAKSTAASMLAGLDHLMPIPSFWAPNLLEAALAAGQLTESDFDTALLRRYTQMFKQGIFERQPLVQTPIDFAAGGVKARAIGVKSAVLLQNDNHTLPFDAEAVRNVVVIGKATQVYAQQAVAGGVVVGKPMGAGGGSSDVVPNYTVSPVDGLKDVLNALGNTSATVTLVTVKDDNSDLEAAREAAAAADAVIVMAGTIAEEGADRASFADATGLSMTALGDGLDWYVAKPNSISTATSNTGANSNTVAMIAGILGATSTTAKRMAAKTALVLKDNAGVAMDPALLGAGGPAILEVWFPGQEDGHIVADLLFGVSNPSGKLPVTFPKVGHGFLDWVKTDPSVYPGVKNLAGQPQVEYKEGLTIGYRWYDVKGVAPAFPFGHGLSYTTFKISKLEVTPKVSDGTQPLRIQFFVENTGSRYGAEVPQVYLGLPTSLGEPPKRLVAFKKVWLGPHEKTKIKLCIDPSATNHPLGHWDSEEQEWKIADGNYQVYLGSSATDIALNAAVTIRASSDPQRDDAREGEYGCGQDD